MEIQQCKKSRRDWILVESQTDNQQNNPVQGLNMPGKHDNVAIIFYWFELAHILTQTYLNIVYVVNSINQNKFYSTRNRVRHALIKTKRCLSSQPYTNQKIQLSFYRSHQKIISHKLRLCAFLSAFDIHSKLCYISNQYLCKEHFKLINHKRIGEVP